MTRTTTLIATGLTTLALSACGTTAITSSSPVKSAAPATTQTTTATPVAAQTPAEAHTGFYNMTTLQNDIQSQETARMADPKSPYYQPGVTVTRTDCIPSGPQTATCLSSLSNGGRPTATATISTDGQTYITH